MSSETGREQKLSLVAAANRGLSQAWQKGFLTKPTLDPASLIARAERGEKSRLEPGPWQEALRRLADDLRSVAALNPVGRSMAHAQLVGILKQRLSGQKLWSRHPEILQRKMEPPLIILGQMRSGTTLMHRLLACDPRFSFTRFHESLYPLAPRAIGQWQAVAVGAMLNALNPALRAIHPTSANAAEEEFGLHAFSFHGAMVEGQWHVPNYARWSEQRDLGPVYREFRYLLQTLEWRRRASDGKIPLLKAPQFMQDLPALLREFPGARIVMLVRDIDDVLASSASLVWHQRRIQSDQADPVAIGEEWRRKTLLRQERALAVLSDLPSSRWIGVEFDRLTTDWRGEIARVYGHLDVPTSPALFASMRRVANTRSHHGHAYSPAQFGFTSATN